MILEPGEIALIQEIAAWRKKAHAQPDHYAANLSQERAEIERAGRQAREALERLFAVALAALDNPVILPEGVSFIGAHPSPTGTLLWFNTRLADGRETTFCVPLTQTIAAKNHEMLQPFAA